MHDFLESLSENLEKMELLARSKSAPVFFARKGFEKNKFWVLIFVLLSSRTRDVVTSLAVKRLIEKYKDENGLAKANERDVEKLIYGVGFYRVKARRIIKVAKQLKGRNFPSSFEELMELEGVGRKTANVVLNILFKKPVIGVDTHVHRISNRLGIVKTSSPMETEEELMKIIPKKYRAKLNEVFVGYGQTICFPKNPDCSTCVIRKYCNYFKNK